MGADGLPGPALARRVAHAAALFHGGQAGLLILSGGIPDPARTDRTEAAAMRALALDHGVPERRLLLEPCATSTFENALFCRPLLPAGTRPLLVTDWFHMPRAWLIFRALGLSATPAPVGPGQAWWKPWHPEWAAGQFYAALREVPALAFTLPVLIRHRHRHGSRRGRRR